MLGVSWLNGQFKAVGYRRGAETGSWEAPEAVDDYVQLTKALQQAMTETKAEKGQVVMVLAHPRLSHQIVEIPPVKGAALDKYLLRRSKNLQTFEGEAVCSHQPALPTKRGEAVLLNIFPSHLLDQLMQACRNAQLHLVRLLPTTAILGSLLKELSLHDEEAVLLAAETGSATTAVIGRSDARLCLARVLSSNWAQQSDRIAVDFTRTVGFAEQQAGLSVSRVILFGEVATTQISAMQALLKLPVGLSSIAYTPFYWAQQAVKLPPQRDGNLISLETRQAPQRRRILTATTVMLILLLLACLGTAGFVELVRKSQLSTIDEMNRMIGVFEQQKVEWELQYQELEQKKKLVELVQNQTLPPVPGWFLAYLGETVPDSVVLTEMRVKRTNDLWAVRLGGSVQGPAIPVPSEEVAQTYSSFTNSLRSGPFHMEISGTPADNQTSLIPGFGLLQRSVRALIPANAQPAPATTPHFLIEGDVR